MLFELPKLPYELNALEPIISARTLEYHYGKHHLAYVNNLNNLIVNTDYADMTLDEIVMKADGGIFNNAAQVWNHTFYWESFSGDFDKEPDGLLLSKITMNFGSFASFKEQFSKACVTLFGSGWAWLVQKQDGTLEIVQESNAGNPMKKGMKPLLTCDVWEHAYYLDYQNRRPDYVTAYWKLIDWKKVEERL